LHHPAVHRLRLTHASQSVGSPNTTMINNAKIKSLIMALIYHVVGAGNCAILYISGAGKSCRTSAPMTTNEGALI
jgi:hypothetical protein